MKTTEALTKNGLIDNLKLYRGIYGGPGFKCTAINTPELKLGKFDGKWEPWQGPKIYRLEIE